MTNFSTVRVYKKLKAFPSVNNISDWHGYAKPTGFPGKGLPGKGRGDNILTRQKPLPDRRV